MDSGRRLLTVGVGLGVAALSPLGRYLGKVGISGAYGEEAPALSSYLSRDAGYRILTGHPQPAVLLFGDGHQRKEWEKEAAVFGELHKKYGVEAFGFEGVYGGPRPNMLKEMNKELAELLGGSTTFKVRMKGGLVDLPYVDVAPLEVFEGFLDRQEAPSFGLENKELDLDLMGIQAAVTVWEYLSALKGVGVAEDKILSYGDVVRAVETIRKRFPETPYPAKTVGEMAERWSALKTAMKNEDNQFSDPEMATFLSYWADLRDNRRTVAMAQTIEKQMETGGYRRVAATVGYSHLDQDYLDPKREGKNKPVQKLLSRSSMVIDAQIYE